RGRRLPAGTLSAPALASRRDGLCAAVRRRVGRALLRSRRSACLRAHLSAGRDATPMRRSLLLALAAALIVPAQASAHATLEQTSPGFRERLSSSPHALVLRFDQYVKVVPGSVRVYSSHGSVGV